MKIIFSPECLEYLSPGHPESPRRIAQAVEFLKQKREFEFIPASPCSEAEILSTHSLELVEKVKQNDFFDPDTPSIKDIFKYASLSTGAAIQAQELALKKEKAFSAMRPPGHHASRGALGGFCYFNNMAVAIKQALLKVKKAAILDLDGHHGNGTQDIFVNDKKVLYVSLHQSPLYPGTGLVSEGNCLNYPLKPQTGEDEYLPVLAQALEQIRAFQPSILGISMGFDSFRLDPLTQLNLEVSTYQKIGQMIAQLGICDFAVLEGGYTAKLGECVYEFISGWQKG